MPKHQRIDAVIFCDGSPEVIHGKVFLYERDAVGYDGAFEVEGHQLEHVTYNGKRIKPEGCMSEEIKILGGFDPSDPHARFVWKTPEGLIMPSPRYHRRPGGVEGSG